MPGGATRCGHIPALMMGRSQWKLQCTYDQTYVQSRDQIYYMVCGIGHGSCGDLIQDLDGRAWVEIISKETIAHNCAHFCGYVALLNSL